MFIHTDLFFIVIGRSYLGNEDYYELYNASGYKLIWRRIIGDYRVHDLIIVALDNDCDQYTVTKGAEED